MFRNYLTVGFRNLFKNRIFTAINITGLGIALSVCIVAFFNHMFNYEFDRTNVNFNEIYRVTCFRDMKGREQEYGIVPATLGLDAKKDIPGIKQSARLIRSYSPVKEGEDIYTSQISYVDPEFLDIFTFDVVEGKSNPLDDHGSALISRTMASRLFGDEHPVGKSFSVFNDNNKEFTFTVGGVFSDLPQNCSFRIDVMTHIDNFLLMWDVKDADWKLWVSAFFVRIPEKSLVQPVTKALGNYIPVQNQARQDFIINRFNLVPLDDVGESSRKIWSSSLFPSLHPAAVVAPPIMAVFILLIACFNFANTSIATFSRRLKEIGLRKTFGGHRKQLAAQFMFETFIICVLAMILGIIIARFLVPAYSSLWSYMSLEMSLTRYPFFWIFLLLLLLLTGFLAGVYPAMYISGFSPVKVMRDTLFFKGSGVLASVLLALQFSISIMALVMGIVFAKNARYQESLDLGYDRDKLIVVPIVPDQFESFRNDISSYPKVISTAGTQNHIGFGNYRRPVKDQDKQLEVDVLDIGPDYANTMGLRLVEGRLFDKTRLLADRANNSIIINQKLAKDFGWDEAIGKTITLYDTTRLQVIGVVEDFFTDGVWQKIEPTMLRLSRDDRYDVLVVRAEPENLHDVLEYTRNKWKEMSSNYAFDGMLQENTLQEGMDINKSITKVNIFLALVATLLSLIGMYNMVSLDIIRRTKEIGIRKIQGAPVTVLMYLLSRKFLLVLLIASVLGCAGGYYMSVLLMDSIWDYFVDIKIVMLLSAVTIMFVATILTVITLVGKAALRNPVVSLRYE